MSRTDSSDDGSRVDAVRRSAVDVSGLRLLALYGSRARGEAAPGSDWDFGYLADANLDPAELLARIVVSLSTDDVDLVDLRSASALLRFRAARDGFALIENEAHAFVDFQVEATQFWCDAGPVIRAAQEDVLATL